MKITTILHPTDFSANSQSAWQVACALAHDYKAHLILLYVQTPPEVIMGEFGMLPPEVPDREAMESQLAALQPTHAELEVTRCLVDGNPAGEIINFVGEYECDLIVIGTHGRTGLGRVVMGGVAEEVVRKPPCPVLTVKTPLPETETGTPFQTQTAAM
jgi:nucleotide-binding universal stress UspA family protein